MVVDISGNAILLDASEVGNSPSRETTVVVEGIDNNCLDCVSIIIAVYVGVQSDTGGDVAIGGSGSELVIEMQSPVLAVRQMITQNRTSDNIEVKEILT